MIIGSSNFKNIHREGWPTHPGFRASKVVELNTPGLSFRDRFTEQTPPQNPSNPFKVVLAVGPNRYRLNNQIHLFIEDFITSINTLFDRGFGCRDILVVLGFPRGPMCMWVYQIQALGRLKTFLRERQVDFIEPLRKTPKRYRFPKFVFSRRDQLLRHFVHYSKPFRRNIHVQIGSWLLKAAKNGNSPLETYARDMLSVLNQTTTRDQPQD